MAEDPLDLLKRAPAPAMTLDENAVLSGGRRRQRRRRLGQVLSSTLVVAVVALGGWWVAGPGRDRSLPGGPSVTTTGPSVGVTATSATGTATATSAGTATSMPTGAAPDNVLASGVAEEIATTNTPYLPVATERLRATVTVAASGSATGRVFPLAGAGVGSVSLGAGRSGAFVLPGPADRSTPTGHLYGLVRAGAGELILSATSGPTVPARWSTSTFPVEGTDVVLVVVTLPSTPGASARWTVSWQSVDGAHSVPVVPGG